MQAVLNGLLQSDLVGVWIGRHGKGDTVRPATSAERTGHRSARANGDLVGLNTRHAGEYRFNLTGSQVGLFQAGTRRQGLCNRESVLAGIIEKVGSQTWHKGDRTEKDEQRSHYTDEAMGGHPAHYRYISSL